MKKMICELCEGSAFLKQGDYFVCQDCGAQYTVETARQLLREVSDAPGAATAPHTSPASDKAQKAESLRKLALRAKEDGDSESAARYYEQLMLECPDDMDAYFYSNFYTAHNIKIAEIGSAASKMSSVLTTTFKMLQNSGLPYEKAYKAGYDYCVEIAEFGNLLFDNITNNWNTTNDSRSFEKLNKWAIPTIKMFLTAGDCLLSSFATDEAAENALLLYRMAMRYSDVTSSMTEDCRRLHLVVSNKHNTLNAQVCERYWDRHPEEKQQILDEQKALQGKIESLVKRLTDEEQENEAQQKQVRNDITSLTNQKSQLGMLKFKEHRALQEQIDALQQKLQQLQKSKSDMRTHINKMIAESQEKIEDLANRLNSIPEDDED